MVQRPLGNTGLRVSPIGLGAFKIGRNVGIKYPHHYELPEENEVAALLNGVLDLGINYIDTAPAYGLSEERIGKAIGHRRNEFVLSTKAGETFENGRSTYDFSAAAVAASVERSLQRLQTDRLDIVFIHSPGDDLPVMQKTDVVPTLQRLRQAGKTRAIGLSGKTVEGARAALTWADVLMVEYHLNVRSHERVFAEASKRGIGIVCKKGLASGQLPPSDAIRFVLNNPAITSMVIGSLNLNHLRENLKAAESTLHLAL